MEDPDRIRVGVGVGCVAATFAAREETISVAITGIDTVYMLQFPMYIFFLQLVRSCTFFFFT